MSADLYTSEIDSDVYGDLFLEMKVGGNLRIITQDPKIKKTEDCNSSYFTLPPTPEGWKEAENLIKALQEWVRHTQNLYDEEWLNSLTKGMDR